MVSKRIISVHSHSALVLLLFFSKVNSTSFPIPVNVGLSGKVQAIGYKAFHLLLNGSTPAQVGWDSNHTAHMVVSS